MHHMREMISSHPSVQGNTNDALISCIEECYSCAQSCPSCADACVAEEMVDQLRQCIRLNLDCADICVASGAIATRRTGTNEQVIVATLDACAEACRVCPEECARHASQNKHCSHCSESDRRCHMACEWAHQAYSPGAGSRG